LAGQGHYATAVVDRRDRHLRLARRAGPAASPPQAGSRRRVTSTPTATISPPAGCAFPLPSKSSVQLLPCATIFTDSETVHHASVSMRFMRTPNAHRCISQRRPNRRAPVAKKSARPVTRMTIGRHCMRSPPHDLPSWACRFHFGSSYNCGSTTDIAGLRIWAIAQSRCAPARCAGAEPRGR